MADFPDIAIADQFADGVQLNAAALDALITHQMNKLVSRLTDGGWTAFTIANSQWDVGGTGTLLPQWRQVGPWVAFIGDVVRPTNDLVPGTSWSSTVLNLPAAARPIGTWIQVCTIASTNGCRPEMKIDTDGTVQFRNTGTANIPTGSNISIATVYPAG